MDNAFEASRSIQPAMPDFGAVSEPVRPERSTVAQFAVEAVDRRIGRVSSGLTGLADSLDDIVRRTDPPFAEPFAGYAASATDGLRKLARHAGDRNADELIGGIGRTVGRHPLLTAGVGAALGAAVGIAVVALGRSGVGAGPATA
ncbi:hypothetical protein [Sphingomonas colocasiae]|uniref:DUF883 family protein n=1 Tax=Sphingomonas colocasiae TaxID=1848973 RepID=A0ABS7PJD0_9SPHN|nr:hypothetical protein [Sphingomonas colocasiae]MBY8820860.1 hypothetical protein [Sphingomonas colocasiae]